MRHIGLQAGRVGRGTWQRCRCGSCEQWGCGWWCHGRGGPRGGESRWCRGCRQRRLQSIFFLLGSVDGKSFVRFGVWTVGLLVYYFLWGLHASYDMAKGSRSARAPLKEVVDEGSNVDQAIGGLGFQRAQGYFPLHAKVWLMNLHS